MDKDCPDPMDKDYHRRRETPDANR
jgi:hypothetical protein